MNILVVFARALASHSPRVRLNCHCSLSSFTLKLKVSAVIRAALIAAAALALSSATNAETKARVVYEASGESLSLEWDSVASAIYDLEVSGDLSDWTRVDGFPKSGEDATTSFPFAGDSSPLFYRLTENLGPHGPATALRLMSGLKYSEEARVSLFFRLTNSQGEPVQLSDTGSVSIFENDKLIDPDESIIKVTRDPDVDKYSLLLFDLSGSLFSNPSNFQKLRDAAEVYLRSIFADGSHYVDIGYFAGDVVTHQNTADPYYVQRNFGYQNDLETSLALLDEIADTVPNDLSTNLFGALYEGHELLDDIQTSSEDATIRNLVVLTDGDDSAGVYSETQVRDLIAAENAKSNGTTFYLIRVGSDSGDDTLESFDFEGLHFADDTGALEEPFANISSRIESESKGLLRVEYESAKRAGNISGQVAIVDDESALSYSYTYDATNFQSSELRLWWHDHDNGSFTVEQMMYLIDAGIPVRYDIGRLYEDLDHVLIATDQGGKLEPIESTVARKDNYHPDYPFLAVFTGEREYLYEENPYSRYDQLTLEIRRKDGRVVKRSEPVPFFTGESQRFNRGEYLHAPGMFNVDYSGNFSTVTNLVGPSGRYLYGIGDMRQPTGRDALYGGLEVVSFGTGLLRFDRLTLEVDLLLPMTYTSEWTIVAFDEAESKILLQKSVGGLNEYTYHLFEPILGRLVDLPLSSGPEGNVAYAPAPSVTGDGGKIVYEGSGYPSTIGIYDLASKEHAVLDPQEIFAGHRLPTDGVVSFNQDASIFAFGTHKTSQEDVFHGIYVYNRTTGIWSEHAVGNNVEVRALQLSSDARFLFYATSYLSTSIDTGVVKTVSGHSWRGNLLNDSDDRIYDKSNGYSDDNFNTYLTAQMAYDGTRSYSSYQENYSGEYGIASRGIAWLYAGGERPTNPVEWYVDNSYGDRDDSITLPWGNQHRMSQLNGAMSADGRIAVLYEPQTYDFFLMDGAHHDDVYDYE